MHEAKAVKLCKYSTTTKMLQSYAWDGAHVSFPFGFTLGKAAITKIKTKRSAEVYWKKTPPGGRPLESNSALSVAMLAA